METMKIGTVEYSLLITHTELGFVYTLSYVDSDCKKHAMLNERTPMLWKTTTKHTLDQYHKN